MKDISQRIEYIRQRNEAAKKEENRATYTIKNWRGKIILYPKIIQVDVEYLMYRIENSRTEIQQMAYLRSNPTLPKNLFSDPESSMAQEAQEVILNRINNSTRSSKDFLDDLARGQSEPAIITYDGYLINGNRRTAALKSLSEQYITCVVLPEDTSPKDIYELEQELQISQDFREPYHWINELRNIYKGIEDKRFKYTEAQIAKRLRISEPDLKAKRRMLLLVDAFLIWKDIKGQYDYSKLEDTEQIFIQLEKAIKKYSKDEKKLEELKNAVFTLIEEKPSKGRLYGHVMDLIKNFDQIYDKFKKTETTKTTPKDAKVIGDKENILDSLLEGEDEETTPIFNDAQNAQEIAASLLETIADIKAENKEKTDSEAVYQAVSDALRDLQGLSIDSDTAKKDSIKNKLEQIINTAQELLEQIKTFEN